MKTKALHASPSEQSLMPDAGERTDSTPCDILVVDDTPENLTAVGVALDGLDCRLSTARSGQEALRRLLVQDFGLILLDVQMPMMTGFDAARLIRARARSRHVPIIFMTAYARDDSEVLEAYRLGAVDFLLKPFQPEILRAKASVFIALERHARQVERQSELLRAHAIRTRESWLTEQRARLESEALKQGLEEQRLRAAELQALNGRLAENEQRKDEFLAALGHELRSPLAPLVSGLEMIRQCTDDGVARVRVVMSRQVGHLIRQVDDLLDMSRVNRGQIELRYAHVRAGDVLDQAVALASPLLTQHRHTLSVERSGEEASIFGDDVRLTQVLANLLNNAARYTAPGGRIDLACTLEDGGVRFSVKDNGRGITAELLPRIFDLFVQEREGGGGLGIGLTLVKHLVQMHHGSVHVHSQGRGLGSEFTVSLPTCPELRVSAPRSEPPVSDSEIRRGLDVVLVDDDDDARVLLGEVVTSWGHVVSHAATGAAGLELIAARRPDIAFVDIALPDLDGYELARRICTAPGRRRSLLVALSGFGQRRDQDRARRAGFDHHLAKPASAADLKRLLLEAAKASEPPVGLEQRAG
jgi:signal transduction histidine kinase